MTAPRVGIFGGSFNPVHVGHLIHADDARTLLGLDRVLFVPARVSPHKGAAELLDAEERAALLALAIRGAPHFALSRVDLDRDGPSYTVETIRLVRETLPPDSEIYFLMGADSLADLPAWRAPDEILRLAQIAVFPRPGYDLGSVSPEIRRRVVVLDAPLLEISSERIRTRIREGRPFRYLVPEEVWRRIDERGHFRAVPLR